MSEVEITLPAEAYGKLLYGVLGGGESREQWEAREPKRWQLRKRREWRKCRPYTHTFVPASGTNVGPCGACGGTPPTGCSGPPGCVEFGCARLGE